MGLSDTLNGAISNASAQFGVSQSFLQTLAQIESGGNIFSDNGVAQGPFQFIPATALRLGITNPFDPQQSANGAATLAKQNYDYLSRAIGNAPNDAMLYLAHQQGAAGAAALLNADPNTPAVSVLESIGIGPSKALKSITGNLGKDYAGDKTTATAGQFTNYWANKWTAAAGGTSSAGAYGGSSTSTATANASASAGAGGVTGWASHWIVRIMVFLLGLVFVAMGLVLFGIVRSGAAGAVVGNVAGNLAPQRIKVTSEAPKPVVIKEAAVDRGLGLGGKHDAPKSNIYALQKVMKAKVAAGARK